MTGINGGRRDAFMERLTDSRVGIPFFGVRGRGSVAACMPDFLVCEAAIVKSLRPTGQRESHGRHDMERNAQPSSSITAPGSEEISMQMTPNTILITGGHRDRSGFR